MISSIAAPKIISLENQRFARACQVRARRGKIHLMNELPEAGVYDIALVFFGYRRKYVCEGKSMNPTLRDGEAVLVDPNAKIKVGDIVIARQPIEQRDEIAKRVRSINERGHYFLIGDNLDDSEDSRHFGAVTREYIKGKVVARLKR